MEENKLVALSLDFAVEIVALCDIASIKTAREHLDST